MGPNLNEAPMPGKNTGMNVSGTDAEMNAGVDASANRVAQMAGVDAEDRRTGLDISAVLRFVGSIAGQATLATALLFYFGWAREQALLGYFGIHSDIAHMTANDYILRSLNITTRILVIVGLLTLVFLAGHRWLSTMLADRQNPSMSRLVTLACVVPGLLLCIAGVLGFYNWVVYSTQYPFVPIMLAIGVTLVGYGFHIGSFARPDPRPHMWSAQAQVATLVVLDIAFIFWAVAVYASVTGNQAAQQIASNLGAQPGITVYSDKSLGLTAPGLMVQRLPGNDSRYQYRYSNLKLLLYSNGRYFLLPSGWRRGIDPVFLIEEGNGIRFEFYTGS